MGELIRDYHTFQEMGAEVLFVSPDKKDQARGFLRAASEFVATKFHPLVPQKVQAEQVLNPPFPILLDSHKEVTSSYGILTTENGLQHPLASTFVIDKQGLVRLKYIGQDYGDRPSNSYLIEVLKVAEKPPKK